MASLYPIVGIDVSKWQGRMDWGVAEPKIHFAYIKASQGRDVADPAFIENWLGAGVHGIPRGAYHYFVPRRSPVNDPKLQASFFASQLDGDFGQLPPMLDCETDPDGLSIQEMVERIYKFLNEFKNLTGLECGVYTRSGWWDPQVTNGEKSATDFPHISGDGIRPLWVAQYNSVIQFPSVPWDWERRYGQTCWTFWQWSADGNLKGPEYGAQSKSIDLNRFNGSLEEFNKRFDLDLDPGEPPDPDPEPEPEPGDCLRFRVVTDSLNVRNGPSIEAAKIGTLKKGQVVDALNVRGTDSWIEIEPGRWACVQYGSRVHMTKAEG